MGADPAITPTQVATAAPALRVIDQQSSCSRTTSLASAGGITRWTCGSIAIKEADWENSGRQKNVRLLFSARRRTAGLHDPLPAVLRLVPTLLNDYLAARECRVSELTECRAG